jgi:hypothetical protein
MPKSSTSWGGHGSLDKFVEAVSNGKATEPLTLEEHAELTQRKLCGGSCRLPVRRLRSPNTQLMSFGSEAATVEGKAQPPPQMLGRAQPGWPVTHNPAKLSGVERTSARFDARKFKGFGGRSDFVGGSSTSVGCCTSQARTVWH